MKKNETKKTYRKKREKPNEKQRQKKTPNK